MSNTVKQWIVFFQLIIIMLCSFGLTNIPGSLQDSIIKEFKIDTGQYGLFFSVSNWAALIDMLHGYLLDRYLGIRLATHIYTTTVVIGVILHCIAGFNKSFMLLLIGRTIYGFGVNPIMLLTNKHIIYWFSKGKYINLVYSVSESILWLGSSACYFVSVNLLKYIENYYKPSESLGITMCIEISVLCVLIVVSSIVLAYLYGTSEEDKSNQNNNWNGNDDKSKLTWRDYVSMPCIFWLFSITVYIYFMSILSFISMSQVFFQDRYNLSTSFSSTLTGLITIIPFLLSPPFGYLLDLYGQNLTCLTAAFILNIMSHAIFTFVDCSPFIPVSIMAISIVLSSSLWSQFQYLVEDYQYMVAYGVVQTGFNGALAVGTLISGFIIDKYHYEGFMTYLLIIIVCTLPALGLIWILNYKKGNILNLNPREKLKYLGRYGYDQKDENPVEGIDNVNYNPDVKNNIIK